MDAERFCSLVAYGKIAVASVDLLGQRRQQQPANAFVGMVNYQPAARSQRAQVVVSLSSYFVGFKTGQLCCRGVVLGDLADACWLFSRPLKSASSANRREAVGFSRSAAPLCSSWWWFVAEAVGSR